MTSTVSSGLEPPDAVSRAHVAAGAAPVAVQARSRRTRRKLLTAGFALLEEEGAEALTIAAISARAGVASGTVYRRFGDKDGLLAGLQEEFTQEFRAEVGRQMSPSHLPQHPSPAQVVELAVRALAETFRAHERLLRVFVVLGMGEERVAEIGARASHEGGRQFSELLSPYHSLMTRPQHEHNIDVAHRLVYAALMHRVLMGPNAESPNPLSWDELTGELVRTVNLILFGAAPD